MPNRECFWIWGRGVFNWIGFIMKEIIEKAVKGGYEPISKDSSMYGTEWTISNNSIKTLIGIIPFETIIFSHDFLKAFFGEDLTSDGSHNKYLVRNIAEDKDGLICPRWKYHGMQLVLSTDRKEYLKRFI